MKKTQIDVKQRSLDIKAKNIRLKKMVPGNVFGSKMDSKPIQLSVHDMRRAYDRVGESGVVYLKLKDEEIPAMIEEVQLEPVTDEYLHVSFLAVDLTEKITSEIPVELVGEFDVPEAVLVTVRDEIEVEALPTDLPEKFVVDVSELTEIGQSFLLSDLEFDQEKVEIVVGEEGMEAPVVLVQEVQEEPEEEEEIETTIIGEEEVEEGAEPEVAEAGEQPAEKAEEAEGSDSDQE